MAVPSFPKLFSKTGSKIRTRAQQGTLHSIVGRQIKTSQQTLCYPEMPLNIKIALKSNSLVITDIVN